MKSRKMYYQSNLSVHVRLKEIVYTFSTWNSVKTCDFALTEKNRVEKLFEHFLSRIGLRFVVMLF